jgi:hypothetical protein
VGLRAGLDTEARGQILSPLPGSEPRSPGHPACSQTLHRLSYPAHSTSTTEENRNNNGTNRVKIGLSNDLLLLVVVVVVVVAAVVIVGVVAVVFSLLFHRIFSLRFLIL